MKYTFTADSGHGWLRVNREEIQSLGIADKITEFSYQRNDYVYLEEDCDLATFFRAKVPDGEFSAWWKQNVTERHCERSHIRGFERYSTI